MINVARLAVFKAALEAVQASIDAHGHIVEPRDAWDFITNLWFESPKADHIEDRRFLPAQMPLEFVKDYRRLALESGHGQLRSKQEAV